ncbi:protein FAR1-RELATED SEQUENCE 5 [Setaria italica]|uniref:protein FAR1-RELATED SEQUENCE 5 n=1 Tax=Setaria italica TaxID=4555 RepID=UPI000BE4D9A6|nr:protein FAR1-RELATED SEQUENCE 5 [Setaria italica]
MATPDPERTYLHDPLLPETIVPTKELRFDSRDEAKEFYKFYAGKAGFDVRITKTSRKTVLELSCNKQGHWDYYKPGEERVREKMSMRCGCKAFVKIKWNQKKDYWFFERIRLEHNHPLHPSPTVTQFLRIQKDKDPIVMGIVDQMHRCDASHNTTVNVLAELYGGRQNFTFTEMDLRNRKAATAREERENDIPKLLEFFREMKAHNEYFYYELQVDSENVIKNVFWSHASQRAEYIDFGDVVTFDTTYKTNMYSMPLAMFVGSNHQLQNVVFGQALLQDEQANTFEWLFGAFKNYQDSSMAAAIKKVFKQTQHRLCRWHMLKKYKAELKKLYKIHDGLKIKLITIINHPLTPTEFEFAWNELVDEYGIREDDTIQGLWESRKLWVAAYFKPLYCGRMTSTQRSESAGNWRLTLQPFDGHLSRVYTRAVYKKYRETYIYSTAFRIDPHPTEVDVYLVTHTDQSWQYAWFQHSFRVEADVRSGRYTCECKTWEHTGLFCAHLIKAFTYLQIDNIPAEYIMKRYTRGARTMVPWDRHDIVTSVPGCESDQYKTKKLVEIAMAAVRACRKTSLGFEKGCEQLSALVEWGESIAKGTGASHVGDHTEEQSDVIPHTIGEPAASLAEQDAAVDTAVQISECAPREARTKGRKRGGRHVVNEHASSSKAQGQRICGYCGSLGHYTTGCDLNPDNINKKRGAGGSLRGKMGRKRGRPPTKRQLEDEFNGVA